MDNELIFKAQMLPVWRTTKNAFKYYLKRLRLVSSIVAVPISLYLVATIFHSFNVTYFWAGPFTFFGFLAGILSVLAILQAMIDGSEQQVWVCYKEGAKKLLSFLWLAILMSAIIIGGFILGIIPGIILSVGFSLSVLVLFVENDKGLRALVKSWNYVRGYWWAVWGRSLFLSLALALLSFVIVEILVLFLGANPTYPGRDVATQWVDFFRLAIILAFILPFQISYFYSLYLQLKNIKKDDTTVAVVSRKTKNWFIGFGVVGVVVPIVAMLLVATFALGGIFGFLLQDLNVNGLPVRAWLYNRGLIEDNTVLIDQTDALLRATSTNLSQ